MTEMESAHATGRIDWETPPEFFKQYDDIYHFTLDVCADASNRKVERFFTKEQNGLAQDWSGERCWCNPPYGRGEIGKWVKKASEEAQRDALVVMLLPARTSTPWFHDYLWLQPEVSIEFIRGRMKFVGAQNSAMFPSMVVTFFPWNL